MLEYSKSSILNGNNFLSNNSTIALSLAKGGDFLNQKQDDLNNAFQTNTNTTTTATSSTIHPLLDIFYNRQLNLMNYNAFNDNNGNNSLDAIPIAQQFSDNFNNFQQFNNFSSDQNLRLATAAAAAAVAAATTNGAQQQSITAAVAAAFLQQVAAAAESQHENSIAKQLSSIMGINDSQIPTSSWQTAAASAIHHPYNNRAWPTTNKRYMSVAKKLDELKNS